MNKKGFVGPEISKAVVGAVIAILLVFGTASFVFRPLYSYVRINFFNESGVKPPAEFDSGFRPYEPDMSQEDYATVASLTALVTAINSIVNGSEVVDFSAEGVIDSSKVPFDSYSVAYSARIELEEDGANDMRDWAFYDTFELGEGELPKQFGHKIRANYYYGSCPSGSSGGITSWGNWKTCGGNVIQGEECRCFNKLGAGDGDDDEDYGEMYDYDIQEELIRKAKAARLAPIREMQYVYNIELTVNYKDGSVCKVSTSDGKLTDTSKNDLISWGSLEYNEDGADMDGDGIKGMYPKSEWGRQLTVQEKEYIKQASKSDEVYQKKMTSYFPKGKIRDSWNNGELCLDSATWLQCPGIRIHYCGKFYRDHGTAGDETLNYFELDRDGDVTSRAGISYTRLIDPEEFTSKQTSVRRETKWHTTKVAESWWEFGKEYDVDIVLRTALIAGAYFTMGPLGHLLASKAPDVEMHDPSIYCEGGKKFGDTLLKCEGSSCAICNFNMPQDISRNYDDAVTWFAAYGDPKYVVYYESFPQGEEEAWIVDPLDISLTTIALVNVGTSVAIPAVGKMVKYVGKGLKVFAKIVDVGLTGGTITFLMRQAVRLGKPIKRYTVDALVKLLKSGMDNLAQKVMSPQTYLRMFSKSTSILKYASDDALALVGKQVHKSADEVAELAAKSGSFKWAVEKILKDKNIVTAGEVFWKALPRAVASKGTKYALFYAGAVALAREDSMNQKFFPIGANSIGWRKPFDKTFKTGEGLPELIPDTNKYYIQLTKDRYVGGAIKRLLLEQNAQRFFLASPCLANLALVKSKCLCWDTVDEKVAEAEKLVEKEDYDILKNADINGNNILDQGEIGRITDSSMRTALDKYPGLAGKKFYYPAGERLTTHDFGGGEMPIYIDSIGYNESGEMTYGKAVKTCKDRTAGFTSITWDKPRYKTDCIMVNPILIGDTFCYSGSHTIAMIGKLAVFAGVMAASIAVEAGSKALVATGVGAPLGIGLSLVGNIAVDVIGAILENDITKATKWPNH
jgi:hypothetical protein